MRRQITKLLNTASSVRQATGILIITALASNILGLVRNTVIAKNIPLSVQDDFWSAFLLPDIVFNVLIFGAISSAFIPLFRGLLIEGKKEEAWKMAGTFFSQLTIAVMVLAIILFTLMSPLVHLLFPRLSPDHIDHVILLSRLLLLQTVLMGWSYLVGGILNAKKRFLAYSLSPILYNVSMIAGALLAPYVNGQAVVVLIWSVVVGAALHLLIQLPSLFTVGFSFKYLSLRKNEYASEIMRLMTPRSISLGILSLNTILFASIARTLLEPGALSVYRLVESFQTAPIAIFANAIAVALFPTLTEYASRKDWSSFSDSLGQAIRFILFTLIPATAIFIILRAQIIRLYIGLGSEITWEDTILAIKVFGWFSIGIVPAGLVAIFARAFYALKNTLIPMLIAIFTLIFGVVTAYTLATATSFGASSLAIAASSASLVQFVLLYMAYLRVVKKPLSELPILRTSIYTVVASLAMTGTIWWVLQFIHYLYSTTQSGLTTKTIFGLFSQTALALTAGLIVFYLVAKLFLPKELSWFTNLRRRVR